MGSNTTIKSNRRKGQIRSFKYVVVLLVGILFSAYLFYSVNDKYIVRNKAAIETATAKVHLKLINELDKIDLAMESMEIFIENSETLSNPVFMELTSPFLDDLNGIILLGWEPDPQAFGAGGKMLHYNKNYDSIPDSIVKTVSQNTLQINPRSRNTILSAPFTGGPANTTAILSVISVYDSTDLTVKGISFGIFDMKRLVEESLRYELPILEIDITDKLHPAKPVFSKIPDSVGENLEGETLPLNAANRVWEVRIRPKWELLAYPHSYESYFVLLLGISSSLLLIVVLKQRDNYFTRLSHEVRSRTSELEKSNALKETLLREIHHRVKNNLQIVSSLINLQKRKFTDIAMIDAFTGSQGRISAIALIHEKIYEHRDTKAVDLKSYLNGLVNYHHRISPSVCYTIECQDITLDLDTAVPIALITSELVVNSLKHAFAEKSGEPSLTILVKEDPNGEIHMTISDNGIGLPENFDVKGAKGLGFEIVHKLCRQINARYSWDATKTGTRFRVSFRQR